ncbi:hypothetical protein LIER_42153 [Lithospermum erythrorhizon]|uniref:Pentatricopeptide repeat-containing protein n=1 Tax=Lithospermum erythrorhizon TaxID=34254 RepID=A0AAV3RK68_LITER
MTNYRVATSRVIHRSLCTETISAAQGTSQSSREKKLYKKLSPLAHHNAPETEVAAILNEWNRTDKPLKRFELIRCIKSFRSRQDYHLALELIRWMETSDMGVNNSDRALEIDLLCKNEGIESAEKYFNELQQSAKTNKTYGALFSCYCREKNLDKALELFEKMKELGFVSTLDYNNLISVYLKTGQPQRLHSIVEEMEQTSVSLNIYTYNILINSYASMKDFDAVEGVLKKMKSKEIRYDWFTYGNLANIYINSGLLDKASSIIKEMENKKHLLNEEALQTMIGIHARTKNLSGVYTAWELLKSKCPTPSNKSYLIMLLTLFKMGESESIEKYFQEWEAGCSNYDVRLSNVLLEFYLNREMIEEANMLYERVQKRGREPNLKACEMLSNFFIKKGDINLALKHLDVGAKIAIPKKHKWYPTDETINRFLEYFEKGNDTENAMVFMECMKRIDRLDSAVYESLVGASVAST